MEELELNKKLGGIWGEQEAIGNIVENTIYLQEGVVKDTGRS